MAGPIATASVALTVDQTGFGAELTTSITSAVNRAQGPVRSAMDRLGDVIKSALGRAGTEAGQDLSRGLTVTAEVGFRGVTTAAEAAGESVQASFREAGTQAGFALSDVGDGGLFLPVEVAAERAGEAVQDSFQEAHRQSDVALASIGGGEVFARVALQAEAAGESIERSMREASTSSNLHLATIGRGLSLLGTALGLAAAGTVGFGVAQAASLEQTRIAFVGLLGSAEAADAFIQEMFAFAARTPFQFQGLANTAQALLAIAPAIGLAQSEIIPFVGVLGDVAAAFGRGQPEIDRVVFALQQMAGAGKVTAGDMRQIATALPIPVFQVLAQQIGITTAELQDQITNGLIPADVGIRALIEGMKGYPSVAGAMIRQSTTLKGLFSTLADVVQFRLVAGFQPLVEGLKALALSVIDTGAGVDRLTPILNAIIPPLNDIALTLITGLVRAFEIVAPALGAFITGLNEGLTALGPGALAILEAVAGAVSALAPLLGGLGAALNPVALLLAQVVDTILPPLASVLDDIITALSPVVDELAEMASTFLEALEPALAEITPLFSDFAEIVSDQLLVALQDLGPDVEPLATSFGELAVALAELLVALTPLLVPLIQLATVLASVGADSFVAGAELLTDALDILTPVIEDIVGAIGAFVDLLGPVGPVLAQVGRAILFIGTPVGAAVTVFGLLFGAIQLVVRAAIFLWQDVLVPFGQFLVTAFTGAVDLAVAGAVAGFELLWSGIQAGVEGTLSVLETVGGALRALYDFFIQPIVNVLRGPVVDGFGLVRDVAGDLGEALGDLVEELSKLWNDTLVPFGSFLSETFGTALDSVKSLFSDLQQAVSDVADTLGERIGPVISDLVALFTRLRDEAIEPTVRKVREELVAVWERIVEVWQGSVHPALVEIGGLFVRLREALQPVVDVVRDNLEPALKIFAAVLAGPVLVAVGAAGLALVGILVIALKVVEASVVALTFVIQALKIGLDLLLLVLEPVASFLVGVFSLALGIAGSAVGLFAGAISTVISVASFLWHTVLEPFVSFLLGVFVFAFAVARDAVSAIGGVFRFVVGVIGDLFSIASRVAQFFSGGFSAAADFVKDAWSGVSGVFDAIGRAIERVISAAGRVASALSRIPSGGGGLLGLPGLIFGAHGGIFDRPTPLIAGEAGAEVLLPLTNPARAMQLALKSGLLNVLGLAQLASRPRLGSTPQITGAAVGSTVVNQVVNFHANPTAAQAREVVAAAGAGMADTLRRRRVRVEARIA